jgi:hypothetical protein
MIEKPPVCDEWEAFGLKDLELAPILTFQSWNPTKMILIMRHYDEIICDRNPGDEYIKQSVGVERGRR